MIEGFGKLAHSLKENILNWIGQQLRPVRFFDDKEWVIMSAREKLWVTYKHHLFMISNGEGEWNIVEQLASGILAIVAFIKIMNFPEWTYLLVPPGYLFMKAVKWWTGNWKDKKDFNALDAEISNRRNKMVREFRQYTRLKTLNGKKQGGRFATM